MRKIFTTLLLTVTFGAFAQDKPVTELTYCGKTFEVSENCHANSKYELTCDDFTIQWLYMNEEMLTYMPQQFIGQLEQKLKNAKKEPIQCVSLNSEIEGYKISYKDGKQKKYKIIVFGDVNGQPVLINLGIDNEPTDNEKLPVFVRQIIELKE